MWEYNNIQYNINMSCVCDSISTLCIIEAIAVFQLVVVCLLLYTVSFEGFRETYVT